MNPQTLLVIAGLIAGLVAITKAAIPDLPAKRLPLLVLAFSVIAVGAAFYSGAFSGSLFDLLVAIVGQAASALGLREAVVAVAPPLAALPSRSTNGGS